MFQIREMKLFSKGHTKYVTLDFQLLPWLTPLQAMLSFKICIFPLKAEQSRPHWLSNSSIFKIISEDIQQLAYFHRKMKKRHKMLGNIIKTQRT
jgi:hypothetical protein